MHSSDKNIKAKIVNKQDRVDLFNGQADQYERRSKKKKSWDNTWRRNLLSFAHGKILEVSAGAGANFRFYPANTESTIVDASPAMIAKARSSAANYNIKADFITSFVEDLEFSPASFDTIISTLSLCSYDDPVKVLNLFNLWCKPDGQVLLLEHGQSRYKLIYWFQNAFDGIQYRRIGCHSNRNILDIVKRSDLEIKVSMRKALGILYIVHAKPGRSA